MNFRNRTLDVCLIGCAVAIMAMHTGLFMDNITPLYIITTKGLFRTAFPFLFLTAGYLGYRYINKPVSSSASMASNPVIRHQTETQIPVMPWLLKQLAAYVIIVAIEGAVYYKAYHAEYTGILQYAHHMLMTGINYTNWYLGAIVILTIAFLPLWKRDIIMPGLIAGAVLYLGSVILHGYAVPTGAIDIRFIYAKIFVMHETAMAPLFLSIGAYIAKTKFSPNQFALPIGVAMLVIESVVQSLVNPMVNPVYFSSIILAPSLLCFCIQNPNILNIKESDNLKNWIVTALVIHPYFMSMAEMITQSSILKFVLTVVFTLPVSGFVASRINIIINARKGRYAHEHVSYRQDTDE